MEWKYVKPLKDETSLDRLKKECGFTLPAEYVKIVKQYNGGRPQNKLFLTATQTEHQLKTFLSLNEDDRENVWETFEWESPAVVKGYLVFAVDGFGNLICLKKNGSVVFYNHEKIAEELVSKSFKEFMDALYS
jgi:hypothetical protein